MNSTPQTDNSNASASLTLRTTFSRLTDADVDRLQRFATLKSYPSNTVLCREGQIEHTFYVLHSGAVKITHRLSDTEEHLLVTRGPGEFFGEMALVDDSPRSATITTTSPVEVIEITDEVFAQV